MATSATVADFPPSRTVARERPPARILASSSDTPRTPRTPLLGRSISSQFGSPGSFRTEQEDVLVYELDSRSFTAGYAGESRPRCIIPFTLDGLRRTGDYRQYDAEYLKRTRALRLERIWAYGFELYTNDLRGVDLGLLEDRLDRALRTAHVEYLQIDQKPRKAVLVVPPLVPTPVLDIALKVLFGHFTQPPAVTVLPSSIMCCASAGLRDAVVIDIGWEETVVTAIGEYKEVAQRRSVRAGSLLTINLRNLITEELVKQKLMKPDQPAITFGETEDLVCRLAWCRSPVHVDQDDSPISIPVPGNDNAVEIQMDTRRLSDPAEEILFRTNVHADMIDDEDMPIPLLAYYVLLNLPVDLRASCLSRIIVTGCGSRVPGVKQRVLHEIGQLIMIRGWDLVSNYGSAGPKTEANLTLRPKPIEKLPDEVTFSPMKMPLQESVPHHRRIHDDVRDPVTMKAERTSRKKPAEAGVIRGVESLGAWAGASLLASLRIKGIHEIERDDYLKHGTRTIDVVR